MRKILSIILVFLCTINIVFAQNDKILNFNKNKYTLLYSAKNFDNNGYINEYYKNGESPELWSELIAVHHFPNVFSPISQAEAFRQYLDSIRCPSALKVNEKDNEAIIDFVLIDAKRLPVILEFNIFKYQKDESCGTKAIQYAKRYFVTNELQIEAVKEEFNKSREKMLKKVEKFNIPNLVKQDIDNNKDKDCNVNINEGVNSDEKIIDEIEQTQSAVGANEDSQSSEVKELNNDQKDLQNSVDEEIILENIKSDE